MIFTPLQSDLFGSALDATAETSPAPSAASNRFARVVPELALNKQFDYIVPHELEHKLLLGHRVRVPWGNKTILAYVVDFPAQPQVASCKPIESIVGREPLIPSKLLELARWLADYYCCDLSAALRCILPAAIRAKEDGNKVGLWFRVPEAVQLQKVEETLGKRAPAQLRAWIKAEEKKEGWLSKLCAHTLTTHATWKSLAKRGFILLEERRIERTPWSRSIEESSKPLALNPQQAAALQSICQACNQPNTAAPMLLQGVTGSGKTEIYLQAIEHVLAMGNNALMLVPEIALTPQTLHHFRHRFEGRGFEIAVIHSKLSAGERHDQWHAIRQGRARIVIGARSAVFAPVQKLGLMIVDEEHETSYKQEEAPHYHGRDVAVLRAHLEQAAILLGSATPSVESYAHAKSGKYKLLRLTERVDKSALPAIHIVDMRKEKPRDRAPILISSTLRDAIEKRLAKKEQVILFINRRGFSTLVQCPGCGFVEECPHCSVSLIYHRTNRTLRCHLCHFQKEIPRACPQCQLDNYHHSGVGTQRVEDHVQALFPGKRIHRMDSDSMRGRHAYEETLNRFAKGEIDLLIGTQMIAKGLHFPNVTCVGVAQIDQTLRMPDFRAAERVFQQLVQVAGRAGRGDLAGDVFIQSHTPFHPAIQFARHHDVEGFLEQELAYRRAHDYPPFKRAALVTFKGKSEEKARFCAEQAAKKLQSLVSQDPRLKETDVPLPSPAPIAKIKGLYRYHMFLRTPQIQALSRILRACIIDPEWPDGVQASIVIDPYQLL